MPLDFRDPFVFCVFPGALCGDRKNCEFRPVVPCLTLSLALLVLGGGIFFSYYPIFWSIPTMVLSETGQFWNDQLHRPYRRLYRTLCSRPAQRLDWQPLGCVS